MDSERLCTPAPLDIDLAVQFDPRTLPWVEVRDRSTESQLVLLEPRYERIWIEVDYPSPRIQMDILVLEHIIVFVHSTSQEALDNPRVLLHLILLLQSSVDTRDEGVSGLANQILVAR